MFESLKNLFRRSAGPQDSADSSPRTEAEILRLLSLQQTIGGQFGPLNCSTVFSCIRILSDTIASLPLKLYTDLRDGNHEPATGNPLYWLLSTKPCPWMTKFDFWKFNINSLLMRGIFLSIVIRSSNGKVIRLVPVNPANIQTANIHLDQFGYPIFPVTNDRGEYREYRADEVFYAYYETLDGIHPVTPLTFAASTIHLAAQSERFGINTLDKGAVLPGYYSTEQKLSEQSFKRLVESLKEATIGNNSGRSPLLDQGIKYNQVTMTAEDMQMLQTRRYQKEELCGVFGVPPHLIGDTAQAKGWSTMEQTMTEFLQLSLTPYLVRIENAIRCCLIPENSWDYAKFSASGLLRGDLTSRVNFYRSMYGIGAMSANEIRAKEEMNSIPGGDAHYRPLNMEAID